MRLLPFLVVVITLFVAGAFCGHGLRKNSVPKPGRAAVERLNQTSSGQTTVAPRNAGEGDAISRIRSIVSARNASTRSRLIAEIANDLDATQIRQALAELEKTHLFERQEIALELIQRWGKLDPQAAIAFVKTVHVAYERNQLLVAAIKGWAETDLAAAREWALARTGPLKDGALRGLISVTAESDPKAAYALLAKLSQRYDDDLAEELFDHWTEKDPSEAARHASQLPKGFLRDQALNVVAQRWATKDITGALGWAESMWDAQVSRVEMRTHPSYSDALTDVLREWMREDRGSAINWIKSISDAQKREKIMGTLVAVEGDRDPALTSKMVFEITEPGKAQDKLIMDVAARWSTADRGGSLQWVEQLPDERMKQMVLPVTLPWSSANPQTVIELAEKIGGAQKQATIQSALATWALANPAAASAWVDAQPPDHFYYYNVAHTWARKDAAAATDWVNKLPPGITKDKSIQMAVTEIEPALATQWIQAISDPAIREQASIQFAQSWLKQDTESARAWVESSPLNQQSKDELLKSVKK